MEGGGGGGGGGLQPFWTVVITESEALPPHNFETAYKTHLVYTVASFPPCVPDKIRIGSNLSHSWLFSMQEVPTPSFSLAASLKD